MTRKGYLLATAGGMAVAGAASAAQAADMAVKAPPLAPAPALWAGWYIGVNAGAVWQHGKSDTVSGVDFIPATSADATGFIGGGQIGYNWQSGNFVFGLEADIDGLTGTARSALTGTNPTIPKGQFSNSIRWLSTIRGRLGVTVGDRGDTLLYATGGVAIGGVNNAWNNLTPPAGLGSKSESKTLVGWAIGGGIEHMLWNSHWTIGVEGLFVDLGKSSVSIKNNPGIGPFKTSHFSNEAAIARLKLNYKF
jgi:outer membrane immunogenic protein